MHASVPAHPAQKQTVISSCAHFRVWTWTIMLIIMTLLQLLLLPLIIIIIITKKVAFAMHCNLKPRDVAPVVTRFFSQIYTSHAHKLLSPIFRSKFCHHHWIQQSRFRKGEHTLANRRRCQVFSTVQIENPPYFYVLFIWTNDLEHGRMLRSALKSFHLFVPDL